jgi:Carboxypeptidase regulatory-like domain
LQAYWQMMHCPCEFRKSAKKQMAETVRTKFKMCEIFWRRVMQQFLQSDGSFPGDVLHGVPFSGSGARPKFIYRTERHWPGWVAPLLVMLLLMVSHATCFAQQGSNAGLTGTVTDKSGAVIGGALVIATNRDTGVTYNATATGVGAYNIPSVPPGSYDVSTTEQGFNKAIVKDVMCHVGELLTVNLKLDVATASNAVTVSGDAQLMETGSAQINNIIAEKELEDWPISATGTSPGGERDISQYL